MKAYTEEQVEEMVREAVEKTERSFSGTFKRLKSENEELKAAVGLGRAPFVFCPWCGRQFSD